ncbi:MAG: HD domain-containing protein, partial [Ruminiclostridium sp.]|nr:HD domain-containing protein [Ruminiclostridium sp.]
MAFLREHQVDIMLFLSGLCAALSLMVFVSDSIPPRRRKSLLLLELSSFVLLMADRFAYLYRGDASLGGYIMVRASNFIVFFMSLFVIFSFNLYLKNTFTNDGARKKVPVLLNAVGILFFLGTILLIISQFTGFYYYFDDQNLYHRNSGIAICYSIPLVCLILQIVAIIRNRKLISRIIYPSILLFAVVPLLATIAQMFTYGVSLTNISIVGMATLIYFFSLKDMNEKLKNFNENEINMLKDEQEHIQALFEQTAAALASAIDAKDKYTHGHSRRVAEYSRKIAEFVEKPPAECREIYYSALLHDVGKIGVPDTIINKEGRLTEEEFAAIKAHPTIGNQILSSISKSPYLSIGAHFHHERFDGNGYPQKLKGNDIPEIARIIAVADAYDAMTSKRSYRDPLPQQIVREEIVKGMDTQFDPEYAKIM